MTLAEDFADYLATTLGSAVTVGQLPGKPQALDNQWAVVQAGGQPATGGNILLWRQTNLLRVLYRSSSGGAIQLADTALRLATSGFIPLQTARVLSATVSPIQDSDQDAEGRKTVFWQVQIDISIK